MYYTIYKITNKINNKFYIGKHKTKNLDDDYMGSGKLINRSIKKYGIENFTKDILFIYDNEIDMNNCEKSLVTVGEHSYNLCQGGQGGFDYINRNKLNGSIDGRKLGRINANIKLKLKYGENYLKIINENSKDKRLHSFRERLKWDINLRNMVNDKITKCRIAALSEESRKKRLETYKTIEHQKGSKNSNYGNIWIKNNSLNISKIIKKNEDIPDGWEKGRIIKLI